MLLHFIKKHHPPSLWDTKKTLDKWDANSKFKKKTKYNVNSLVYFNVNEKTKDTKKNKNKNLLHYLKIKKKTKRKSRQLNSCPRGCCKVLFISDKISRRGNDITLV